MGRTSRATAWLTTATLVAAVTLAAFGAGSSADAASVIAPSATIARPAPQLTGKVYQVEVRAKTTDADPRRMQAAVDAGGQVAITYDSIKRTIVSAHNYSDATALTLHRGDVVKFGGKMSGAYRVTSAIRVRTGSSAAQVLRLKTKLMMQTCVFRSGDSRVVGLKRLRP